jgi:hypothetical protein
MENPHRFPRARTAAIDLQVALSSFAHQFRADETSRLFFAELCRAALPAFVAGVKIVRGDIRTRAE